MDVRLVCYSGVLLTPVERRENLQDDYKWVSFLALDSVEKVTSIDANVRSMLYGYAEFELSDRAVGKKIAAVRKS